MDTGREGGKGMKKRKRTAAVCALILWLGISLVFESFSLQVYGAEEADAGFSVESPGAFLMEASTGTVIYEKDADTRRSPASVTKIMTALLIFENLENGKLHLSDEVVTSAHAKSMGGSQVFLEEGEKQTVETLLKCILVASGNDAAVAMAEHIAGTEEEFVSRMNQKAEELGMENTHFTDCRGLTDSEEHYTTPRDIALMSRELITKYPEVFDYTRIWMENITHVTARGSSEFGLTNTNKLLRSYDGCDGLKTGSTSKALFCISATAERNGIRLISVIMAGPDSKTRFRNAAELFNYGFGSCRLYTDENRDPLPDAEVRGGTEPSVSCKYQEGFRYLDTEGMDFSLVEKEILLREDLMAPIEKGETLGKAVYRLNGEVLGEVPIVAGETLKKAEFLDYLKKLWERYQSI